MNEENKTTFRTKDLNQAAFIWTRPGSRLVSLEGTTDRATTVFFRFELDMDERDLAKLIIEYANKETTVEPQEYCSKQSNLRDLLHGNLSRQKREVIREVNNGG